MQSGGAERYYFRFVPAGYDDSEPAPLVLDLHGYAEGAEVHKLMSRLQEFGNDEGFVTITPHGTGPVPRWDTAPSSADMAFLTAVLDEVETELCVDTARVYVTGLSNGAMMTSAIACGPLSARVAAVAPVAGVTRPNDCDATRPVPVVAFHGTDDQFLSYDGGVGPAVANLPSPDGSGSTLGDDAPPSTAPPTAPEGAEPSEDSVPGVMARWAQSNGCSTRPDEEKATDDVTQLVWECPPGDEVELYRVEGGGHSWPGSDFSKQVASVVGKTTFSISANEVMWEFFLAHPLAADS
jgi:polyhydroxybutyrate depolymerase